MIKKRPASILLGLAFLLPGILTFPSLSPSLHAQTLEKVRGGMWLRDVTSDPAGRVWISLDREGIQVLGPVEDPPGASLRIQARFNEKNSGLPSDDVPAVAPDGTNGVWFGSVAGGLAYLDHGNTPADPADDRWAVYTPESTKQGLPEPFVYSISVRPGGQKWIGTQKGGLCCLDDAGTPLLQDDDRWITFGEKDGLACPWVYGIVPHGASGRWLATWGGGLGYFDDHGTPFDRQDDRWAGYSREDGLPGDKVRAVAPDPAGGLWIAALGGLAYLDFAGTPLEKNDDRWAQFLPGDGLPNINVMDVAVLQDGTVWVALWGGGLASLDTGGTPLHKQDDRWEYFGVEQGLTELIVNRLHTDSRGLLWLGTWGDGLFVR
jgi:ligand-binding sensor domain-containing protein